MSTIYTGKDLYDPYTITIEAYFTSPTGKTYHVNGFYFQDYTIIASSVGTYVDPTTTHVPIPTSLPWRVRFAPNEIGTWTYHAYIGYGTGYPTGIITSETSDNYSFNCISSTNHGFLSIAPNNRYLQFSDGTSFFGIGEDLGAYNGTTPINNTYCASVSNSWTATTPFTAGHPGYTQATVDKYTTWINNFAQNGGNLIRVWMGPSSFELEWPDPYNYVPASVRGDYTLECTELMT